MASKIVDALLHVVIQKRKGGRDIAMSGVDLAGPPLKPKFKIMAYRDILLLTLLFETNFRWYVLSMHLKHQSDINTLHAPMTETVPWTISARVCGPCKLGKRRCNKLLPTCSYCQRWEVECHHLSYWLLIYLIAISTDSYFLQTQKTMLLWNGHVFNWRQDNDSPNQTWGLGISGTTQGVYGWIPNPGFLGWMVIQHTHGFRVVSQGHSRNRHSASI
jgi:hypothetical protein